MDLPVKFKLFFIISSRDRQVSVKSFNYVSNLKIEASNRLYTIEAPRFKVIAETV